jgi:hypothetical protein
MTQKAWQLIITLLLILALAALSGCAKQTLCQSVQNLTERNDCYKQQAIASKDVGVCENIQPEQQDGSGIFIVLARMDCYNQIAVMTKNASLCYVYSRYNSASICVRDVAVAMKDSSACAALTMEQDICYYRIAVLNSDIGECEKISDQFYKGKCLDELNNGEKFYCLTYGC